MTATADTTLRSITRRDVLNPVLSAISRHEIVVRAGTIIATGNRPHHFDNDTAVPLNEIEPGRDYGIGIDDDGVLFSKVLDSNPREGEFFAGFHLAPAGNALAREGGDADAAINPHSIWDIHFRPSCPDPRGMTLVSPPIGKKVWVDIYLLGVDHHEQGTSRHNATIANGRDLPKKQDSKERYKKLDYAAALEIYTSHGKRLLGAEEFFAAAYGIKERASRDQEPTVTGTLQDNAINFISKWGVFDVTGTMWQWGTDGDPDEPRPSLFGGSWINGADAGSRYAYLGCWPENSSGDIGARGASDHLNHA